MRNQLTVARPMSFFDDDSDGLGVWGNDKVEALVPVVSARIEQAYRLIAWIKLYGLSDALREIAP